MSPSELMVDCNAHICCKDDPTVECKQVEFHDPDCPMTNTDPESRSACICDDSQWYAEDGSHRTVPEGGVASTDTEGGNEPIPAHVATKLGFNMGQFRSFIRSQNHTKPKVSAAKRKAKRQAAKKSRQRNR